MLVVAIAAAGTNLRVPEDHATLESAIGAFTPGDRIVLGAGTFPFPAGARPESLWIVGAGAGATVVQASPLETGEGTWVLAGLALDGMGAHAMACEGGRFVLDGVTLRNGGAADAGVGGLLRMDDGCRGAIHGGEMRDTPSAANGGLVGIRASELDLVDTRLVEGVVSQDGGAVHLRDGVLRMAGTLATGNRARNGGVLHASRSEVDLLDSDWATNTASMNGGGIWATSSDVRLWGGSYTGHDAIVGGVLYGAGATARVEGAWMLDNHASERGGAIASGELLLRNSWFEGNSGSQGGAVAVVWGAATSERNVFCGNTVTSEGGAVWANDTFTGIGDLYVGNGAPSGGAALFWREASVDHATAVGNLELPLTSESVGGAAFTFVDMSLFGWGFPNAWVSSLSNTVLLQNPSTAFTIVIADGGDNVVASNLADPDFASWSGFAPGEILVAPPALVAPDPASCDPAGFAPGVGSPAIDGGTGAPDHDGSPADIGFTGGPVGSAPDADGDGLAAPYDCDDADASVRGPTLLFPDADGDGHGSWFADHVGCSVAGMVATSGDCDDSDSTVFPGAEDVADNGLDEDCSGVIDDAPIPSDPPPQPEDAASCACAGTGAASRSSLLGWIARRR